MLQFSPQNHQWESPVWRRDEMLSFVLGDDASLRRFIERADRVQAGLITSLSSGPNHQLEELGAFMAMIGGFVVSERVRDDDGTPVGRATMLATLAGLVTLVLPGVALSMAVALGIADRQPGRQPQPCHRTPARRAGRRLRGHARPAPRSQHRSPTSGSSTARCLPTSRCRLSPIPMSNCRRGTS